MLIQWKIFIPVQAINFTVTTPLPVLCVLLWCKSPVAWQPRAERIGLELEA